MSYINPCPPCPDAGLLNNYDKESLRLECVTTCVGFDDILDITLQKNHPHFDTMIVVTNHEDKKTQKVARKYGALCVQTDLFKKNGRNFNKGAAINAGFDMWQYNGFRLHLDSDIVLPDNFRRILFNHSHLERHCIYGADRMNVIGEDAIKKFIATGTLQHKHRLLLGEEDNSMQLGHRLVCSLRGYLPCGFFQLTHCSTQKPYPYSLGSCAHDDMIYSASYPENCRRHLPSVICYHLVPGDTIKVGQNWEGKRATPRLDLK